MTDKKNEKMPLITRVTPVMHEQVRKEAFDTKDSMNGVVVNALEEHFTKEL